MASAADFRSQRSSDQRRFRQASGHHPRTSDQAISAGFSCDQRCMLYRFDKRPLTRQTERFFTIAALFSHSGKTPDWDTHTQTHSTTAVSTYAAFDFRDSSRGFVFSTLQSFQRSTLFSKAYLKRLAFRQCHLTTQALPELRTLLPIQLSAAFTSRR